MELLFPSQTNKDTDEKQRNKWQNNEIVCVGDDVDERKEQ